MTKRTVELTEAAQPSSWSVTGHTPSGSALAQVHVPRKVAGGQDNSTCFN